jgi:hypothetical protein
MDVGDSTAHSGFGGTISSIGLDSEAGAYFRLRPTRGPAYVPTVAAVSAHSLDPRSLAIGEDSAGMDLPDSV